jgi:hypothetical protein
MKPRDPLLYLLQRFREQGVEYVLVGGQAVRLNGYLRATEDVDVVIRASRDSGARIIRALDHFASAAELKPEWFAPGPDGVVENIRVAAGYRQKRSFPAMNPRNGERHATRRSPNSAISQ